MVGKLWVLVVVLSMVLTFTLKANAQQATLAGNPQGQSQVAQLRQEIESLRQQQAPTTGLHGKLSLT